MVFDSEAQKQTLINLLVDVPVQVSLGDIFSGKPISVNPQVAALVKAIHDAEILEPPQGDGQEPGEPGDTEPPGEEEPPDDA